MSADGGTLTTTGYIEHHLTNLAVCADSAKVDGVCTGFWTFHLDTLLVSGILGLVVFGLMAMLASKATSGIPSNGQNFVEMVAGGSLQRGRQEVDRDQVHGVHDENPDKDGDRQRSNQGATAMESVTNLLIDETDDHFDKILAIRRDARGGFACQHGHQAKNHQAQYAGNKQSVEVESPETRTDAIYLGTVRTDSEIGKVVFDITCGGQCAAVCAHVFSSLSSVASAMPSSR
eukprot:TRINITY_DN1245_c0_g1_i5.p1 TRINITY_DN1245_c0_g1~~TRINITY_DN1245_c0_g1_i5.p1  ORF type:complete len:232 (+),score=0.62 TRINITY_DN1245_c0_g1_i5:505-1200(+)